MATLQGHKTKWCVLHSASSAVSFWVLFLCFWSLCFFSFCSLHCKNMAHKVKRGSKKLQSLTNSFKKNKKYVLNTVAKACEFCCISKRSGWVFVTSWSMSFVSIQQLEENIKQSCPFLFDSEWICQLRCCWIWISCSWISYNVLSYWANFTVNRCYERV